MKETRKRLESFNLYDYQGVEAHLEAMAARGWRLVKTGNSLWTYRRAEPAAVRYAVTFQDASQFDPLPTEDQKVLEGLCEAAGWEKVCDWQQMQIYATEAEHPVPLETDEALRLELIHRVMKRHVLPANWVLLALSLVMNVLTLRTALRSPIKLLESNAQMFGLLMYAFLTLLLLSNIGTYWLWRRRSEKSVAAGGACAALGRGCRWWPLASLALVLLAAAGYILLEVRFAHAPYALFFAAYMAAFLLLAAAVQGTRNYLKRRRVSRGVNRAVTLAVDFVLAFLLIGGLVFGMVRTHLLSQTTGQQYSYRGEDWDLDPVPLPLTISDLTGKDYNHTRRRWDRQGTPFLEIQDCQETVAEEEGDLRLWLNYKIQEPRGQWVYDLALESLLAPHTDQLFLFTTSWREEDPAPWGAETVWRQYAGSEETATMTWVLCWPGRIVTVNLDLYPFHPEDGSPEQPQPDPETKALVGRALGPG